MMSTEHSWEPGPKQPFYLKLLNALYTYWDNYIVANAGVSLLILAEFLNSIMIVSCKLLETDKDTIPIHPIQILFVRMIVTYICCLAYMFLTKSVPDAPWGPRELRPMLALRGFAGFFGVFGLYFPLQYLSLSDSVAITFLVPMVTPLLAWMILQERYSILEAVCLVVSLGGVLLIARPSFLFGSNEASDVNDEIESLSTQERLIAIGVALVGVCAILSVYIILRKIGHRVHALLSVSYFALWCVILTFFAIIATPSLLFILPQSSRQWFLFTVIGFTGFFMQFSMTAGVQRVKAGKASLLTYVSMVFAIVWDLLVWHHFPSVLSWLGIVLIVGNAAIVLRYQPTQKASDGENADYESVPPEVPNDNERDLIALDFIERNETRKEGGVRADNEADINEADGYEEADRNDQTEIWRQRSRE